MDIVTHARNIGAVLGTASVIAYVCGYLSLRVRAFALGIEPAFKMVDELYVFAGFRVLFATLVVLLLSSPVILLLRWGAMSLAPALSRTKASIGQWLLLVALAIATILSLRIFSVSGILLHDGAFRSPGLANAILGGASNIPLLSVFALVPLLVLSGLWLQNRMSDRNGPFEWILTVVVALQLIMLPVYHGAFFADRRVRVLSMSPDTVKGLNGPLGIVDRTADQVTLLGLDTGGKRRLVTVALGDLNGIPIRQVVTLEHFVRNVLSADVEQAGATDGALNRIFNTAVSITPVHGDPVLASTDTEENKSFFSSLLEDLRITLQSIGSLGESFVASGELWEASLDASGQPSGTRRIGTFDNLAWPVTGPDGSSYYALRQKRVIRINAQGRTVQVSGEGTVWRKLLGVREDGTILGLVRHEGETRPARLPPGGQVRIDTSALTQDDKTAVARLMQEARSYADGRALLVNRSQRGGRGFDVFLKTGEGIFNVSDCGDDSCGQASLSPDLRRVLFIRQPRY